MQIEKEKREKMKGQRKNWNQNMIIVLCSSLSLLAKQSKNRAIKTKSLNHAVYPVNTKQRQVLKFQLHTKIRQNCI